MHLTRARNCECDAQHTSEKIEIYIYDAHNSITWHAAVVRYNTMLFHEPLVDHSDYRNRQSSAFMHEAARCGVYACASHLLKMFFLHEGEHQSIMRRTGVPNEKAIVQVVP